MQIGTPTEFKPTVKPTETKKEQKNLSIFGAIKYLLNPFQAVPKGYEIKGNSETVKDDNSEYDQIFTLDEKDSLFPPEEF